MNQVSVSALGAHAVHHVHARQVFVDHRVHGVDVVLAVAVDGNGHVGQVLGGHQARQQSVLMAAVAGKADAPVVLVRFSQASDDVPGLILGTVVDEQYAAFVRYLARCGKVFDFFQGTCRWSGAARPLHCNRESRYTKRVTFYALPFLSIVRRGRKYDQHLLIYNITFLCFKKWGIKIFTLF